MHSQEITTEETQGSTLYAIDMPFRNMCSSNKIMDGYVWKFHEWNYTFQSLYSIYNENGFLVTITTQEMKTCESWHIICESMHHPKNKSVSGKQSGYKIIFVYSSHEINLKYWPSWWRGSWGGILLSNIIKNDNMLF